MSSDPIDNENQSLLQVSPKTSIPTELKKSDWSLLVIASIVAGAWFLVLSHRLDFRPNRLPVEKNDVLFNSDAASWIGWLSGNERQLRPSPLHALVNVVWRPLGRTLFAAYHMFLPHEEARVLAARTLVAAVAGVGFGSMALLAVLGGLSAGKRGILLCVYPLFSANLLVVSPEHWGLSNGLLSVAGLVVWMDLNRRTKIGSLVLLTILLGGTTITNAIYPGFALLYELTRPVEAGKSRWLVRALMSRKALVIASLVVLVVLGAAIPAVKVIAARAPNLAGHISSDLHLRILRDPMRAFVDILSEFVYPAVAPLPETKPDRLTYLHYEKCSWGPPQVIAALAWIVLLGRCAAALARREETRGYLQGLIGWVLVNSALHSIWGDEVFLYTPHWSWCLAAVVFLGARDLSVPFLAIAGLLIIPGQIQTLGGVIRAVRCL